MKSVKLALLATLLATVPAVANAQDVGATVYGNDGNPIGTVEAVANGVVTIDTGKHKAPIPANLIGTGETGPSINATKEQIDSMMDAQIAEANAKRDAALVLSAPVISAMGKPVGTLSEVDLAADAIVLESPEGPVALKKEHFAVNPQGQLMALFTLEQIASAAASAKQTETASASADAGSSAGAAQ
jgi:sporulation protein YlmC with PRC-barrel domain